MKSEKRTAATAATEKAAALWDCRND